MSYASGIAKQIGPFMYAGDHVLARRKVGKINFIIGIAGAYNARGLIGPEHNGIFVLDDTNKNVVTDRNTEELSGYSGPSERQLAEFERVKALSDREFLDFAKKSPNYRGVL